MSNNNRNKKMTPRTAAVGTALIAAAATATLTLAAPANAIWGSTPYNSDGMWLVPTEVATGTYRVEVTSEISGYSKTCADYTCEIGTSGFIDNEVYRGPGVLVIPANTVLVHLRGVSLTRMA